MSNTMEKVIDQRVASKMRSEVVREIEQERIDAAKQLAECERELAGVVPRLDAEVVKQLDAYSKTRAQAEASIAKASKALQAAQSERSRQAYTIERVRDGLQSKLQGELRHPAISRAMEAVEKIYEENRHVTETVTPEKPKGHQTALFVWIQSTREQLRRLQYSDSADVQLLVDAVMDGQPTI